MRRPPARAAFVFGVGRGRELKVSGQESRVRNHGSGIRNQDQNLHPVAKNATRVGTGEGARPHTLPMC
jgi:hypothetical protein